MYCGISTLPPLSEACLATYNLKDLEDLNKPPIPGGCCLREVRVNVLEVIRRRWTERMGFEPVMVASFDHMAVGFSSRIIVGYELLRRYCEKAGWEVSRAVSLILDTVTPDSGSGSSLNVGFLPAHQVTHVANPAAFFFRAKINQRRLDREALAREVLIRCSSLPRKERSVTVRRVLGGWDLLEPVLNQLTDWDQVVAVRSKILGMLDIKPTRARMVRYSSLFSLTAEILDDLARLDLDLSRCPQVDRLGLARLVNEDGTEGERIYEFDDSLLEKIANCQAVPTIPITILCTSLAYPHWGNDYGHANAVSHWLGLSFQRIVEQDHDSYPVGHILRRQQGGQIRSIASVYCDLLHFYEHEYRAHVFDALNQGGPVFKKSLGT